MHWAGLLAYCYELHEHSFTRVPAGTHPTHLYPVPCALCIVPCALLDSNKLATFTNR